MTSNSDYHPCTYEKACHIKYLINRGLSQTETAIRLKVNQGTVCHVVHGRRYPSSEPVPPPDAGLV